MIVKSKNLSFANEKLLLNDDIDMKEISLISLTCFLVWRLFVSIFSVWSELIWSAVVFSSVTFIMELSNCSETQVWFVETLFLIENLLRCLYDFSWISVAEFSFVEFFFWSCVDPFCWISIIEFSLTDFSLTDFFSWSWMNPLVGRSVRWTNISSLKKRGYQMMKRSLFFVVEFVFIIRDEKEEGHARRKTLHRA